MNFLLWKSTVVLLQQFAEKKKSYFQENLDNDFKKTATSSSHTISKRRISVTQFLRKIASIDLVVQLFWVYPSLCMLVRFLQL